MPTNVLILKADQSFIEKSIRVRENFAIIDKNNKPNFSYGQSVFRERRRLRDRMKFWKKPRNLLLWPEGSKSCFTLIWPEKKGEKDPQYLYSVWTQREAKEYVDKQRARAGIRAPLFAGWPFYIMFALVVANTLILLWRFM